MPPVVSFIVDRSDFGHIGGWQPNHGCVSFLIVPVNPVQKSQLRPAWPMLVASHSIDRIKLIGDASKMANADEA